MRVPALLVGLAAFATLGGCRNDSVGTTAGATDSGTGVDTAATDSQDAGGSESGSQLDCERASECDDDDPCTSNACMQGACVYVEVLSNECRPTIDVDFPARAATVLGAASGEVVTVTGRVHTPRGNITGLVINGDPVAMGTNGSFSYDYSPSVGGNTLVLDTIDDLGNERRRVQSFLWSTQFAKPTTYPEGMGDRGMAIYLSQGVLDDGDHSAPYNDLASIMSLALATVDLSAFVAADTPVAQQQGYDIYLTALTINDSSVGLEAIDGGLHLRASIDDIEGDLLFDCDGSLTCLLAGGDGTGGLNVATIGLDADILLGVNAKTHELEVTLENVDTSIDPADVTLYSNNPWTGFLLALIQPLIVDGLVTDLATTLNDQLSAVLGPVLQQGLSAFAINTTMALPNLGQPGESILLDLRTDFLTTDFHDGVAPPDPSPPQGGVFNLRGGAFVAKDLATYDNRGVPQRMGCGLDEPGIAMTRTGLLEIGLHDDLLNQLLYAGWRGGLLEFPLDGGAIAGLVSDLEVQVSGMLAPTASDCGPDGELVAQIGDLRIDASLVLAGTPITFVAFSTLEIYMDVVIGQDGGIGITLSELKSIQTELTVSEAGSIPVEAALVGILEDALKNGLVGALGGGSVGGIDLPEIDLSASLGLPPGSAVIAVSVDSVSHVNGTSVIAGHL